MANTMMKLLLLFVGLLASIGSARTILSERQTKAIVKDGSFEQIPESDEFKTDTQLGGWNFTGRATYDYNFECKPGDQYECTPYGKNYVVFFKSGGGIKGTVFQRIHGLSTSTMYTLGYAYDVAIVSGAGCSITTTLAQQTLDTLEFPANSPRYQNWTDRAVTFKPSKTEGTLTFNFFCGGGVRPVYYELYLDNVSIMPS